MQTIGERLEEARKRKGISVREAAETTKIRGDYLQKFEANSFDLDLPPLYIRGFIRSYARFLDLDPERILNDLDSVISEGKPTRRETREVYGRVDFAEPARAHESGEAAPKNRTAQDQAVMLKFGLLAGGGIVVIIALVMLVKVLFGGSSAKPASDSPPAATIQAEQSKTLTLTAVETTRIKVVQEFDGAVLFNASLGRGESQTLKMQGKLLVTVEAGKNLRLEINGRSYPVPLEGYGRFAIE